MIVRKAIPFDRGCHHASVDVLLRLLEDSARRRVHCRVPDDHRERVQSHLYSLSFSAAPDDAARNQVTAKVGCCHVTSCLLAQELRLVHAPTFVMAILHVRPCIAGRDLGWSRRFWIGRRGKTICQRFQLRHRRELLASKLLVRLDERQLCADHASGLR